MSQDSIERILGKVLLDGAFRETLLADPEQTLSLFPLTQTEKAYLKRMDAETLDQLATLLAQRSRLWGQENILQVPV